MRVMPASCSAAQCRGMAYRLPLIALFLSTSAALAQTVPVADGLDAANVSAGGEVYRLSPAEIEATLDAAATRNASQMPPLPPLPAAGQAQTTLNDGKPHGEAGMMIGTGGARAVWGSTVMPLGQNGVAAFSFSTGRWPGAPY